MVSKCFHLDDKTTEKCKGVIDIKIRIVVILGCKEAVVAQRGAGRH